MAAIAIPLSPRRDIPQFGKLPYGVLVSRDISDAAKCLLVLLYMCIGDNPDTWITNEGLAAEMGWSYRKVTRGLRELSVRGLIQLTYPPVGERRISALNHALTCRRRVARSDQGGWSEMTRGGWSDLTAPYKEEKKHLEKKQVKELPPTPFSEENTTASDNRTSEDTSSSGAPTPFPRPINKLNSPINKPDKENEMQSELDVKIAHELVNKYKPALDADDFIRIWRNVRGLSRMNGSTRKRIAEEWESLYITEDKLIQHLQRFAEWAKDKTFNREPQAIVFLNTWDLETTQELPTEPLRMVSRNPPSPIAPGAEEAYRPAIVEDAAPPEVETWNRIVTSKPFSWDPTLCRGLLTLLQTARTMPGFSERFEEICRNCQTFAETTKLNWSPDFEWILRKHRETGLYGWHRMLNGMAPSSNGRKETEDEITARVFREYKLEKERQRGSE